MQDQFDEYMRLQKFLARAGVASRRNSELLISTGHITINGSVVTEMGIKVDVTHDVICFDGKRVYLQDSSIYLMLHKPAGFLTTMDDPQGRPTVASLVPIDRFPSLYPVGRLDKDTTGLLLFTTDGTLGQRLLHPKHHVCKTYRALVDGFAFEDELDLLRQGILLDDGWTKPAKIHLDRCGRTSQLTITISEGRKRQVKRMCSAIHHPVIKLHRDVFAGLELGDLPEGAWRFLSAQEIEHVKSL